MGGPVAILALVLALIIGWQDEESATIKLLTVLAIIAVSLIFFYINSRYT